MLSDDKSANRPSVKRKLAMGSPRSTRKKVCYDETSTRIWSDEDVLVLLQSILDYRIAYNKEPNADYSAFLHFVKDKLNMNDLSVRQLGGKVRKLKYRYSESLKKGEKDVGDDKVFELLHKVWGRTNDKDEVVVTENEGDEVVVTENEGKGEDQGSGFEETYPYLSEAWGSKFDLPQHLKELAVANFMMIGGEKLRALECEWKGVSVEELKLDVKKLEWRAKVVKAVLDEMEGSGD
ncbi:hypothetical protein DCAR_0414979 [Daucus carota subsp. sativus]|uniref:Glabrous enhancer-binding protein-like DBD domain-containing protein n=1 Tax=Daucus carota subsp. sativus TaxID=79200 RepID=A0A165A4P7_DAUCS|nr:PREDICTED: uncharacterized protein LOC108217715 [Daucus carota subsp. sativus]WOG95653.1 hypothetical protein DCAR_0414979 [Daucus carota subsp. sativus]